VVAEAGYEAGSLLDSLDRRALDGLLARGSRRRVRKGSTLFVEGDRSDVVLAILSGRVRVFTSDASGRETVLAIRGPGDVLGELTALDGNPRSASATALETAEVVAIPGDAFRSALDEIPSLARVVLATVVGRLRDSDRKRAEFGGADAARRVARRLVELADRYGEETAEGIAVQVSLSQDDLAGWTGASREAVSRAIGDLRRAGLIGTARRAVTILDLEGLRRRAA
jgi:CRP-like cAMP-binding protein